MNTSIKDTIKNQIYKLKYVDITLGFDQGLYGDYYFGVHLDYMNDEGNSGTWVTVAKFIFNSENPHLPPGFKTSEVTKEQAYEMTRSFAQQLALKMNTDVHIRGNVLDLINKNSGE